jgi:hypothetical protein
MSSQPLFAIPVEVKIEIISIATYNISYTVRRTNNNTVEKIDSRKKNYYYS